MLILIKEQTEIMQAPHVVGETFVFSETRFKYIVIQLG